MLTVVRINNCFFLAVSVRFSINRPVRSRFVGEEFKNGSRSFKSTLENPRTGQASRSHRVD